MVEGQVGAEVGAQAGDSLIGNQLEGSTGAEEAPH